MSMRRALEIVDRVRGRWLSWRGRHSLTVWFDPLYRLPLTMFDRQTLEPRRAAFVAWALQDAHAISAAALRPPPRVSFAELARVHTPHYLESLLEPNTLARIFAVETEQVRVDALMDTIRLACGATLAAARTTLATGVPALNLLGGFHHAGRSRGGGLCAVNDIAVAVAALRAENFTGQVNILDLDAHPPDGTAECMAGAARVWIGSLSGCSWGTLEGVDETVLPEGCGDGVYLQALERLLGRMPRAQIAFVIAGGDVLAGDPLGRLGLSLDGARNRDLSVLRALSQTPAVWLPGGGYTESAWKVLAGTGLALAGFRRAAVTDRDPLASSFATIGARLNPHALGVSAFEGRDFATELEADLFGESREARLLDEYSIVGIEHALHAYGILDHLGRLGYRDFRIAVEPKPGMGDRLRVFGTANDVEYLLIETVLERQRRGDRQILYVHWLALRHPRAATSGRERLLPGQEVPGLGLARELGELFVRIAARLELAGVTFRPSHYHTAFAARHRLTFVDAARQGRFEALVRDLAHLDLADATRAIETGHVRLNGAPYAWEPDEMFAPVSDRSGAEPPTRATTIAAVRAAAHFTVDAQ